MMNLHLVEVVELKNDTVVMMEKTVNGKTTIMAMDWEDLKECIINGLEVTYAENVEEALKCMTCQYVEVTTDEESKEVDVYVHKAEVYGGTMKMKNDGGQFVKTYKRVNAAMKFAQELGGKVVAN